MKTIKDILKSDSIEQRKRIAKNLIISREDKNALIVNESNGGGGGTDLSNVPCYYYKIIKTPNDEMEFDIFFKNNAYYEYVVNAKNHGTFQTNVTNAYEDYTNIIALKLIDIPIVISYANNEKIYTKIISGDVVDRVFDGYSTVNPDMTLDVAQGVVNTYAVEITKEEYEALITIKPE